MKLERDAGETLAGSESRRSRFRVVLGTKGSSNYHNTLLHLFSCVTCFFFFSPLEGKVSGFYLSEGHYPMTQSLEFFFYFV